MNPPSHKCHFSVRYTAIAIVIISLTLVASCGRAEPTATLVLLSDVAGRPTATSMPPTSPPTVLFTPEPTTTPELPVTSPAPTPAPEQVRITIVYDNTAYDPRLKADWGFAALIEYSGHFLLFDTGGSGPTLLGNLARLGFDLEAIDTVVLSHIHGDHVGGLRELLTAGVRPTVYVPAAFPASFKDDVRSRTDLVEVTAPLQILPGVHSTGELGSTIVEQALVLETFEGIVVITGCAHPGIVQMVRQAQKVVKGEVALVIGGFHLGNSGRSQLETIVSDFRQTGVKQVSPTHCTGEIAVAMFADEYGDDYVQVGVGRVIVLEPALPTATGANGGVFYPHSHSASSVLAAARP